MADILVALAVVGRMKLLTRLDVFAAMPLVKLDRRDDGIFRFVLLFNDELLWLEFETALRKAGRDGDDVTVV